MSTDQNNCHELHFKCSWIIICKYISVRIPFYIFPVNIYYASICASQWDGCCRYREQSTIPTLEKINASLSIVQVAYIIYRLGKHGVGERSIQDS